MTRPKGTLNAILNLTGYKELTATEIAQSINKSRSSVWKCLKENNLSFRRESCGRHQERASGLKYSNSPAKLNAIREKYKNGVSMEILEEWIKL